MVDALGWTEWMQLLGLVILLDVPRYLLGAIVLAFLPPRSRSGNMSVSGLVACHNEEHNIRRCVESMRINGIEQIVVVNDGSIDNTHQVASALGVVLVDVADRVGKPNALNIGLPYCTCDLVLVADADTTFQPNSVREATGHFEPDVGGVGLDLKVRNETASLITRSQALEYAIAFTAGRRIADALGVLPNVSGAAGLFRRAALEQVGGWDCEVAEDAALAMKLRTAGWRLGYAPLAIAWTSVPETLVDLGMQRLRWDASIITIYWRKFSPWSLTSLDVLLFGALLPLILPVYLFWLWSKIDGSSLLVLLGAMMFALMLLELVIVLLVEVPVRLLLYLPFYVLMQLLVMRPTRIVALVGELAFNITRRDDYIPASERWRLT